MSEAVGHDRWWSHEGDPQSITSAVRSILDVYGEHGRASLERFGRYPESFRGIDEDAFDRSVSDLAGFHASGVHFTLARIRLHEGDRTKALRHVEAGLRIRRSPGHQPTAIEMLRRLEEEQGLSR
jgi:hypothetical protein